MKIFNTKIEEVKTEVLDKIICDVCKKEFQYNNYPDDFEIQEFFSINTVGGYGSVFGDEERFRIDICQHCFKDILEKYGINVSEYTSFYLDRS